MKSIDTSYLIKSEIEGILDKDKLMQYTLDDKIKRFMELKKWLIKELQYSMYPQDETEKLKSLQNDIDNHLVTIQIYKNKQH